MIERLLYLRARLFGWFYSLSDELQYRLLLVWHFLRTQEPSTYRGIAMLLGGGIGAMNADERVELALSVASIASGLIGIFTHDRNAR